MIFLLFALIVLTYFFFRKIWFNQRKIRAVSTIEKITLRVIRPDIILPEVEVLYKYYSQRGVYYGKGYLHINSFIGNEPFVIYMKYGAPVMEVGDNSYVTEEIIEHYLLSCHNSLIIFIDPVEPFHSMIDCVNQNYIEAVS